MMMLLQVTMSFQLLVLMASTAFFIWALRTTGSGRWLALIVGIITFLFSLSSVVCTTFYSMKYWHGDSRPYMSRQHMMPAPGMGNETNQRMQRPMMQEGMPMNNQHQKMMDQRQQRTDQKHHLKMQSGSTNGNQPYHSPQNQSEN